MRVRDSERRVLYVQGELDRRTNTKTILPVTDPGSVIDEGQ